MYFIIRRVIISIADHDKCKFDLSFELRAVNFSVEALSSVTLRRSKYPMKNTLILDKFYDSK